VSRLGNTGTFLKHEDCIACDATEFTFGTEVKSCLNGKRNGPRAGEERGWYSLPLERFSIHEVRIKSMLEFLVPRYWY